MKTFEMITSLLIYNLKYCKAGLFSYMTEVFNDCCGRTEPKNNTDIDINDVQIRFSRMHSFDPKVDESSNIEQNPAAIHLNQGKNICEDSSHIDLESVTQRCKAWNSNEVRDSHLSDDIYEQGESSKCLINTPANDYNKHQNNYISLITASRSDDLSSCDSLHDSANNGSSQINEIDSSRDSLSHYKEMQLPSLESSKGNK